MASLIFTDTSIDARSLCRAMELPEELLQSRERGGGGVVMSHTPYLVGTDAGAMDHAIRARLAPYPVARPLTDICVAPGSDTTLALAELTDELRDLDVYALAGAGSALGTFSARMQRFAAAVGDYEGSMGQYWKAARWRTAGGAQDMALARRRMQASGTRLAEGFRNELARAGSDLSLRQRGLLVQDGRTAIRVREARGVAHLEVRSVLEASRLSRMARHAAVLGRGLVAFDFVRRGAQVHAEYEAGGDWQRTMVGEAAGFGAGLGASALAVSLGTRALGMMVLAVPGGWVLVLGGLAVVAASATAGMVFDHYLKRFAEQSYSVRVRFPGHPA